MTDDITRARFNRATNTNQLQPGDAMKMALAELHERKNLRHAIVVVIDDDGASWYQAGSANKNETVGALFAVIHGLNEG